ncbi:MAG: peptide chain release factor N(5)-glutamine methyltransferase [Prevotellaceae bacterium]|jgi:release factor glutamine methyltransferase|nr:peptide chain release factor N(5)-glutamine methyltransferase [Prevotellaceae bacterium]
MQITPHSIRRQLQPNYPPSEAANLARLICCELLHQSAVDYYLDKDITLSPNKAHLLEEILTRLCNGEPIQYITGEARFMQHTFRVTPHVLIPRPETEELVERILADHEATASPRIVDIGTGSGCIAASLAKALPGAQVTGWDISAEALVVAAYNCRALQVEVVLEQHDLFGYQPAQWEQFDLIVSNPPYITESEKSEMEPHVLEWEPSLALFVPDSDPLRYYRRIAQLGQQLLPTGGKLYFEINRAFGAQLTALLQTQGYRRVVLMQDIAHANRFIRAER